MVFELEFQIFRSRLQSPYSFIGLSYKFSIYLNVLINYTQQSKGVPKSGFLENFKNDLQENICDQFPFGAN